MSALSDAVEDYVGVRRSLGFKLTAYQWLLSDFVAYLEAVGATTVTTEAAVAWATQPEGATPGWRRQRLGIVRGFAGHLRAFDPNTEVPPAALLEPRQPRPEPHLYSDGEVVALMTGARALSPHLRAATFETLIGLLAVSGLRPGEALRLDRRDIDWADGAVRVVGTKFGKRRDVPLQHGTLDALSAYGHLREERWPQPRTESVFVSITGARLAHRTADWTFQQLVRRAGLAPSFGGRPPRLADLRHTFAVNTLIGWYRAGADVEACLPLLSTVLGHSNPCHTYWYLSAAPELLALAAVRRGRALEDRR